MMRKMSSCGVYTSKESTNTEIFSQNCVMSARKQFYFAEWQREILKALYA